MASGAMSALAQVIVSAYQSGKGRGDDNNILSLVLPSLLFHAIYLCSHPIGKCFVSSSGSIILCEKKWTIYKLPELQMSAL